MGQVVTEDIDQKIIMAEHINQIKMDSRFIKNHTARGIVWSFLTSIIKMVLNFGGNLFLARLLAPAVFGAFGILTFWSQQVPVLLYDLGLPNALIQKKGKLTRKELASVFTVNALVAFFLTVMIFVLSPILAQHYQVNGQGAWLFRMYSLIVFTFVLESIPLVLLKRRIGFDRLVWVSLAGAVSFNLMTVILALAGFGLYSLILGTFTSRIFGLLVLFKFQKWHYTVDFQKEKIKKLLNYGLPLKGTALVGLTTLSIVPLLVGSVSGLEAVGYFHFSDRILGFILVIPGIVSPILFSSLSRSQDKPRLFKLMLEKTTEWIALIVFPIVALFLALAPQVVSLVFSDQWLPGLPVFYLSFLTVGISCVGGLYYEALLSIGKSGVMLKIATLRGLIEWTLSLSLIMIMGYPGVALAKLAASLTFIPVLLMIKRQAKLRLFGRIFPYLAAALLTGIIVKLLVPLTVRGIASLLGLAIVGGVFYFVIVLPFKGRVLWLDVMKISRSIKEAK